MQRPSEDFTLCLEFRIHPNPVVRVDREQIPVERRVMGLAQRKHVPKVRPMVGVVTPWENVSDIKEGRMIDLRNRARLVMPRKHRRSEFGVN
jgi:hypothetical protein